MVGWRARALAALCVSGELEQYRAAYVRDCVTRLADASSRVALPCGRAITHPHDHGIDVVAGSLPCQG